MEILKKSICAIIILCQTFFALAQNEAMMQKSFSESYTLEYNKKYTEAIAVLSKLNDNESYEINLRLGWLNYLNKKYTQAEINYQKAVSLKPYSIESRLGLVKSLAAVENWDKVMQQYEEILKIDPQNYTANYWTGVIYYNRKKFETASKLFEKLVNMYPFDYDANHMLAWTFLNMGRMNDAKMLFNKALLNKPGDASCLEGLGKIK